MKFAAEFRRTDSKNWAVTINFNLFFDIIGGPHEGNVSLISPAEEDLYL